MTPLAEPAAGAPEKYEPFTLPEGFEMPEALRDEAETLLRDLNLPQDKAQKAVDFFTAKLKASSDTNAQAFAELKSGWRQDVFKDPEIGTGTDIKPEVKQNYGRAIALLPVADQTAFREAMNLTGVGDNPAFIKAMNFFGKRLTEGRPAVASAPAAVAAPDAKPASLAQAIYPNLPA